MKNKINYIEAATSILNKNINETEMVTSYWIEAAGFDVDGSLDYCQHCADRKVAVLENENPNHAFYSRRNYDGNSTDTTCSCEECGKDLKYSLTEAGVRSELSHFSDRKFDIGSEGECYALRSILECHGEYEKVNQQIEDLAFSIVSMA